jgi:hypothetical protein
MYFDFGQHAASVVYASFVFKYMKNWAITFDIGCLTTGMLYITCYEVLYVYLVLNFHVNLNSNQKQTLLGKIK